MQRANKRKFHYIYKITRTDGKYYIGMHSTDNLDDGYFGSGKLITRSIKKHGIERHSKEILEFLDSRESLKVRERELVCEEIIIDTLCMNLQLGGGGGFIDQEHQRKCSAAGGKVGGKIMAERISKIGAANLKDLHASGNFNYATFSGKAHSKQSKLAIAKKMKEFTGERNSQFGTCWVTDGIKPVKIKKEHFDEYLTKGFIRGRSFVIPDATKVEVVSSSATEMLWRRNVTGTIN